MKFSERYGYTKVSDAFIIESMPEEIINAICTAICEFEEHLNSIDASYNLTFKMIDTYVWTDFMHKIKSHYDWFVHNNGYVLSYYFQSTQEWYQKLNLLEFMINASHNLIQNTNLSIRYQDVLDAFVDRVNGSFEDLHYGYRIIDNIVVPITDKVEISALEKCLSSSENNVAIHISNALEQYAKRPDPDFRNSIKESISAVEYLLRKLTGKNTLGEALNTMQQNGMVINTQFKSGLEKLYTYTNDPKTGIRHALMEDVNAPTDSEAHFMLVLCSAFVNYINSICSTLNT